MEASTNPPISPDTERVHRRNIYDKLGISSQAELCSLFFEALAEERLGGPPLAEDGARGDAEEVGGLLGGEAAEEPEFDDPALAASWGVALAQRVNAKKNSIFERDREHIRRKSLKQRILGKLLFWR